MAESWRERVKRQARAMDRALAAVFASETESDQALRQKLEELAQQPLFREFTWTWGPKLAARNRVIFRPFILSYFSSVAINADGEVIDAWQDRARAVELERWLAAVDAADDVELTRRLYGWRLSRKPLKEQLGLWRRELVERFSAARSPAARFTALAKVDTGWMTLDAPTALALYEIDHARARPFILSHIPSFYWSSEARQDFGELLERSREPDPEFHFDLYRRTVDEKTWRADVLALCRTVVDPELLDAELERRHPRSHVDLSAEVFYELVRERKRAVVPYVMRHASSIFPRWRFWARREASGLPDLLALAREEGWLDLWAALLKTGATRELFDAEVQRLVRSKDLADADVRTRLALMAGPGREANFPGVSFAQVQPLEDDTALALYRRFPALLRGPYRMHVAPGWNEAYPRVVRQAIENGDDELVDYFASRAGMQVVSWGDKRGWKQTLELLTSHFEALSDEHFVRRAGDALSRMPAFAIWSYDQLLRTNALARLLFERSTSLYLSTPNIVRDLLESPQIHVQALALRILGQSDPRARDIAARNVDLLQATLLRPLHRRTRLLAFKALENAASLDEATAGYLLGRMRDALALPEKRYPTEELIGLIAKTLYLWPSLRRPGEVPQIFGAATA